MGSAGVLALTGREQTLDGAVRIAALQPQAIVAVDGVSAAALSAALGESVKGATPAPRRTARSSSLCVLWSAPDQWLLVDEREPAAAWYERLRAAFDDDTAVTDLTHARVAIRLEGAQAVQVLLTGCAMDLASMTPGDCAATRLSHFQVLVECVSRDCFQLLVPRSLALAAWDWLLKARAEFEA